MFFDCGQREKKRKSFRDWLQSPFFTLKNKDEDEEEEKEEEEEEDLPSLLLICLRLIFFVVGLVAIVCGCLRL